MTAGIDGTFVTRGNALGWEVEKVVFHDSPQEAVAMAALDALDALDDAVHARHEAALTASENDWEYAE